MGIRFVLGATIGEDISFEEVLANHDAVFLGLGTYRAISGNLANGDAPGVYAALDYLVGNTRSLLGVVLPNREAYRPVNRAARVGVHIGAT